MLSNIVAGAMIALLLLGLVGWLSFVVAGSVPRPIVIAGVYSIVVIEIGTRMLGRLQRLRLF